MGRVELVRGRGERRRSWEAETFLSFYGRPDQPDRPGHSWCIEVFTATLDFSFQNRLSTMPHSSVGAARMICLSLSAATVTSSPRHQISDTKYHPNQPALRLPLPVPGRCLLSSTPSQQQLTRTPKSGPSLCITHHPLPVSGAENGPPAPAPASDSTPASDQILLPLCHCPTGPNVDSSPQDREHYHTDHVLALALALPLPPTSINKSRPKKNPISNKHQIHTCGPTSK